MPGSSDSTGPVPLSSPTHPRSRPSSTASTVSATTTAVVLAATEHGIDADVCAQTPPHLVDRGARDRRRPDPPGRRLRVRVGRLVPAVGAQQRRGRHRPTAAQRMGRRRRVGRGRRRHPPAAPGGTRRHDRPRVWREPDRHRRRLRAVPRPGRRRAPHRPSPSVGLHPRLRRVGRAIRAAGRDSLPALRRRRAHRHRPGWPTLVDAVTRTRPVIDAVDMPLAAVVAALAMHEVAVWASGLGPQTLDGIVEIPYGFGPVQRVGVDLHPRCGCGWPTWQDTMGA